MLTIALPPTFWAYCVSEIIADRNAHSQPSTSVLLKKLVFLLVRVEPSFAVGVGYFCVPKKSFTPGASLPDACALASAGSSENLERSSRASATGEVASNAAVMSATPAPAKSLSASFLIITQSPQC